MKIVELFTESLGWLKIVASPLLIGGIAGMVIYLSKPDITGLVAGLIITLAGLVTGIVWATKVWKKQGTMNFLSRAEASPDMDKLK